MPDTRRHRGPHPQDRRLFAAEALDDLRHAVEDLSLLLSRGYSKVSALKLVGDRFQLSSRQRDAVRRSSCPDGSLEGRRSRRRTAEEIRGGSLYIDGYNLLICVESALAGGVVLEGRDGCFRDLASLHGSYRRVEETLPAFLLIGESLTELAPRSVVWYFDAPVSNSGRLVKLLRDVATERGWPWTAELLADPDAALSACGELVASSDSVILDQCRAWFPLSRQIVATRVPDAWVVSLGPGPSGP